jgi:hypothetical protein
MDSVFESFPIGITIKAKTAHASQASSGLIGRSEIPSSYPSKKNFIKRNLIWIKLTPAGIGVKNYNFKQQIVAGC